MLKELRFKRQVDGTYKVTPVFWGKRGGGAAVTKLARVGQSPGDAVQALVELPEVAAALKR